jgi:indole-3-glycerol phosphate synthase
MENILHQLADSARRRVASDREKCPLDTLRHLCADGPDRPPFLLEKALRRNGISFICEVKKASPSKGILSPDFPYLEIAKDYESAGADCISCLTEPEWFLGSDEIFTEIRSQVTLPMLRKDFTVDEYQIYQAKRMGADAVLLICALLDTDTLRRYVSICDRLGLSALVEAHDALEISSAVEAGARIVGVNNRNLKNFTVDLTNSLRLRALTPPEILFVAESGIHSAADVEALRHAGVDGVLVGESLMRAADRGAMLAQLRGRP